MKDASDEALALRLKDIVNNLAILTPDGKIGALPIGADGIRWMTLLTHVHEEYVLRGESLPHPSQMRFPKPTAPNRPDSVVALKKIAIPKPKETLVKFGKHSHMKDLFELGRIRIAAARSYSDPSLNYAIRDDELQLDQVKASAEVTITHFDKDTGLLKNAKPISEVVTTTTLATNFYVYCMAHTLDYRLFDDFEADACVVIRKPSTFAVRLMQAVREALPDWIEWSQKVQYIDPYLWGKKEVDLFFSKHFRFWYQKEYRFAWIPESNEQDNLEPIFVELGSLDAIAEFVQLTGNP